jgi:tRNA A-37 threonylcarbamoyl transferase component Bud32
MRNMKEYVNTLSCSELKVFAKKIGVKGITKLDKQELLDLVYKVISNRFVSLGMTSGKPGKEGIAKIVWDQKDKIHRIKKQFKNTKSGNTLTKEAEIQKLASVHGISPEIFEIDVSKKHIIMEKMDSSTLIDIIIKNEKAKKPLLSVSQQRELLALFKKLDEVGIFHGDPNPLNFMRFPLEYHKKSVAGKMGLIDYGFGKIIKSGDYKEYFGKPNESLMVVGLFIILKKRGYKASNFPLLFNSINKAIRVQFELV